MSLNTRHRGAKVWQNRDEMLAEADRLLLLGFPRLSDPAPFDPVLAAKEDRAVIAVLSASAILAGVIAYVAINKSPQMSALCVGITVMNAAHAFAYTTDEGRLSRRKEQSSIKPQQPSQAPGI